MVRCTAFFSVIRNLPTKNGKRNFDALKFKIEKITKKACNRIKARPWRTLNATRAAKVPLKHISLGAVQRGAKSEMEENRKIASRNTRNVETRDATFLPFMFVRLYVVDDHRIHRKDERTKRVSYAVATK